MRSVNHRLNLLRGLSPQLIPDGLLLTADNGRYNICRATLIADVVMANNSSPFLFDL